MKNKGITILFLLLSVFVQSLSAQLEILQLQESSGNSPTEKIFKLNDGKEYYSIHNFAVSKYIESSKFSNEEKNGILVTLNAQGAAEFEKITTSWLGKRIGILVDNKLICAPFVLTASKNGKILISLDGYLNDKDSLLRVLKP